MDSNLCKCGHESFDHANGDGRCLQSYCLCDRLMEHSVYVLERKVDGCICTEYVEEEEG